MNTQTTSVCIVHTNIAQSWVEGTLSDTGQNVSHHQSDIIWTTILYLHSYLAKVKWYKKLSELSSLYLMTNSKIGNHGVWSESKEKETTTATTYLVHFEDHINPNCTMGCMYYLFKFHSYTWMTFHSCLKSTFLAYISTRETQIIRSTPPRIPRISGLKSQVLKPTFLS